MKALGLNPGEQEMIDMTNEVNVNGLIYYPDFCKIVLRKYREENRDVLNQALFKVYNLTFYYFSLMYVPIYLFQQKLRIQPKPETFGLL